MEEPQSVTQDLEAAGQVVRSWLRENERMTRVLPRLAQLLAAVNTIPLKLHEVSEIEGRIMERQAALSSLEASIAELEGKLSEGLTRIDREFHERLALNVVSEEDSAKKALRRVSEIEHTRHRLEEQCKQVQTSMEHERRELENVKGRAAQEVARLDRSIEERQSMLKKVEADFEEILARARPRQSQGAP